MPAHFDNNSMPLQRKTARPAAEFNHRVEAGLRQAPIERAKAVREFWNWIIRKF